MKLVWDESAWADYLWWQGQDRKILRRINLPSRTSPVTETMESATEPLKHAPGLLVAAHH